MKDTRLLDKFNEAKQILCRYDYYLHLPKRILHLTNTEAKIPHLMGLQYIAGKGKFEGDRGAYMIKSGRLQYNSIRKLIRKYYKKPEKQESMAAMVYGKIDNLVRIREMLATESCLFLYDIAANPELNLKTDYLLVNQQSDVVLQLGLVKAVRSKEQLCHCNSFMVDYKKNEDYDLHYRNLTRCYEISKIIREDKQSKERETIYLSEQAELRERSGIAKMFAVAGIGIDEGLLKMILRFNVKFGNTIHLTYVKSEKLLLYQQRTIRSFSMIEYLFFE